MIHTHNGYLLFEKLMYRVSILMYNIGIENMNEVSFSELMPLEKDCLEYRK